VPITINRSISLEGRMDNFQKDIDDRANLTLSNRFELLLFRLGASMKNEKSELLALTF
jgi:two-component system chemotaxis response regulator CheV